ncbi:MAG: DNA methylase N-4 [Maritimibacter sp.]|nr:DNA methylase N-4 [Maritimibacter sp.]
MVREIALQPIDKLNPYGNNPRNHTDRNVGRIAGSIETFGFVLPILVESDGTIIAGHGRYAAAKRLRLFAVPTICVDHLTKAQVRALRIADNRLAELSDWNRDALQIEFADLVDLDLSGDLDFDLELTGFDLPEIDLIIEGAGDGDAAPPETVEEPDRTRPAVTRAGDLWHLGRHRLLCGNALEPESYDALLDGEIARMVFTDPPYNVRVNGHVRSGQKGEHREFAMASGEMTDAEFHAFLSRFITRFMEPLPEGGVAMICMDWRHIADLIVAGKGCGLELINLCVWNKTNGGMGGLYRSKHELVCIFRKPGAPHINNVELGKHGRNRTNVWDYAGVNSFGKGREADLADHPTVKPTALVADALLDVTHRGDVVLDCFGGSGATLLAAEKTGRKARLIELDPLYVDVTIRRWQEATGQDAVHATTGETWTARAGTPSASDEKETADVDA